MLNKMSNDLPGPEKAVARLDEATTDGSKRLRYPVVTGPYPALRVSPGAWVVLDHEQRHAQSVTPIG